MSRDIQQNLHKDYGVRITYMTAYRAKPHAERLIAGSPEDSFKLLPAYCHVLKGKNPGTVIELKTDDRGHFLYFFFALGACIRGFRSFIRPVIAVDGTFLKGPYLGYMFIAVGKDGNSQIYPLAWGIVDSENDASWEWFMEKLRSVVGDVNDLVFISNLHASIEKAVCKVFPNVYHGVCIYHLQSNLVTKFNIPLSKKKTDPFVGSFFQAAKAYREIDFENQLCNMRWMKPEVVQYLQDEVGFHKWARSKGAFKRYDIMTTNIAESITIIVKEARKLPITLLVDWIREFTQNWFYDRKENAKQVSSYLTTWADHKICKCQDDSNKMLVHRIDNFKFLVKDGNMNEIVDIAMKTCSCKKFDLRQLPCLHAIAVCKHARLQYQILCSFYYTTETLVAAYGDLVNLVDHPSIWIVPDEVQSILVLPPLVRKQLGRRRQDLISSRGENISRKTCSRCKQHGHNRATCRSPAIVLSP